MKVYLGDSVFVDTNPIAHGAIMLTTENGLRVTNTIILEPEVLAALDVYRAKIQQVQCADCEQWFNANTNHNCQQQQQANRKAAR